MPSIFLVVSKFIGLVGATVAIPMLWSDHRWLSIAAFAALLLQLVPKTPPLVRTFSDAAGTGLFVFALSDVAWLAIVAAVLDILFSTVLMERIRLTLDHMASDILAGTGLTPERIRQIQALGMTGSSEGEESHDRK